jgi:uncharacterized protein
MLFKIHKATRIAVAVCDSDLIGKKFEEENKQLDLTTTFFQGEEKTKEEILELLDFYAKEDACFNIVGKESCDTALECGLIAEESVSEIDGIPFGIILC